MTAQPPGTGGTTGGSGSSRAGGLLRRRWVRLVGTLVVTGGAAAYIVSKIDLGQTAHTIGDASLGWLALSAVLTVVTVPPQAYRWKLLLRARGIEEPIGWLTRAYFVSYAVGQVLPTGSGAMPRASTRRPGATQDRARPSPARCSSSARSAARSRSCSRRSGS